MGQAFGRLLQRSFPVLRQKERQLEEHTRALEDERRRHQRKIEVLEEERERQQVLLEERGVHIKVLEDEKLAMLVLLDRLRDQLSEVGEGKGETKLRITIQLKFSTADSTESVLPTQFRKPILRELTVFTRLLEPILCMKADSTETAQGSNTLKADRTDTAQDSNPARADRSGQVNLRLWLVVGLGVAVVGVLYSRWRREVKARDLAEYRWVQEAPPAPCQAAPAGGARLRPVRGLPGGGEGPAPGALRPRLPVWRLHSGPHAG